MFFRLSKKGRRYSFSVLLGVSLLLLLIASAPAQATINVQVAPGGTVDIVLDSSVVPVHTGGWGAFNYLGINGPFGRGTTARVSMNGISVDNWGTGNFNATSPSNRVYTGETLRYTNDGTGVNTTVSVTGSWGNGMDTQAETVNILITNNGASVVSINMMDPNPTVASSVRWQVLFDQAVTGVKASNFQLSGGVTGSAITGVSGSGTTWTVTASTGTGTGLLGLNMVNGTGVSPQVLGLSFTGQPYSFDLSPIIVTNPANVTILAGQSATMTATVGSRSASAADPIKYQWYNAPVGTRSNPVCAQGSVTTSPAAISCPVGTPSSSPANGYWVDVWNNYNAGSLHTVSMDGRVYVNHLPALAVNLGLAVDNNSSVTLTTGRLQATDQDQDASSLTYTVTTAPAHGTLNRTTFTQWDIDNGQVTYTPTSGYFGSDGFIVKVSDGVPAPAEGILTNKSVAISVNDPPVFIGSTTTLTVEKNSSATDIKNLLHVSDMDASQTLTWSQTSAPDHGGVLGLSGVTATSGSANIAPGDTITYQPATGYSGPETFTIQVSDGTTTATRTISVTVNDSYTVTYNGNGNDAGSVPTDGSSPYNGGTSVTVLGNTGSLTRAGYTFTGWNSAADGSDTAYAVGSSFTIFSNVILYAAWQEIPIATAASAITAEGFTANWNAAAGATRYYLDVATDSGFTSLVGGYNNKDVGNTTSSSVTGLAPGTTYYYRVRAYNGLGSSDESNTISVATRSGRVSGVIVDPAAPSHLYCTVDGGGVFSSTDSGGTWAATSGQPASNRLQAIVLQPGAPAKLFAASYGSGVYVSPDSGASWSACTNSGLTGSALNVTTLASDATGRLYAGTGTGIFTSTDCDAWTSITGDLSIDATKPPVAIVIDPTLPNTIYAGLDGGGVYKSINGGTNWTAANNNLTNLRVKALARSSAGTFFAATYGNGVFNTTDSGDTWSVCGSMANQNVLSLTIDGSGRLYAGTEAGIFTSTNNCATWTAINSTLP